MMDALDLLLNRTSCARLQAPAPVGEALDNILRAGLRAPDHARLRPWRFLLVEGDAREALGGLIAAAQADEVPSTSSDALEKSRRNPLRAPLIIVVVAAVQSHPKVPDVEQLLSAGAAAHQMLLAARAQGFGGIWRTGFPAYSAGVRRGLGLAQDDQIVGYLYLGTPASDTSEAPLPDLAAHVHRWTGVETP